MKNRPNPRVNLTILTLQARIDFMEQLAEEGIMGSSVAEVADFFIMRGIDEAVRSGMIERRHAYRAEGGGE